MPITPRRFQDLPVGEVVAVPFEVLGQVVGALLIRDPTMKENPASSSAFRFAAESIPASATTTMSVTPWRSWNASAPGSAWWSRPCSPRTVHLQREPARVDQQPDLDLRVDPALLAHPDLAQLRPRSSVSKYNVVQSYRTNAAVPAGVLAECARQAVASCPR